MALQQQAADLRAELASLQNEITFLKNERDVARLLNEYVYVHDAAFSPASQRSDELDAKFEDFFTGDGICEMFGVHTTQDGKAEWVRSVLLSKGNIIGIQMIASNTLVDVSDDGLHANARTSAVTSMVEEGQSIEGAVGYYTYRLRKVDEKWKIAYLKWHGV